MLDRAAVQTMLAVVAPEFSSVAADTLAVYLDLAEGEINVALWGKRAARGAAFLTAHLLTLFPPTGVTPKATEPGPVQSRTVGQVSVTYAVAALDSGSLKAGLGQSRYGIEYARLVRIGCFGPQVL